MKKYGIFLVLAGVACILSNCDLLSDAIWTNYIWGVERKYYNPDSLDTGLPVIRIDTEGQQTITSKENYLKAAITISGVETPGYSFPTNAGKKPDYNYTLPETVTEVRGRGNVTWWYPKRPYRIKLDKKQPLFDYTSAKSWVLLANHQDPTLMMNTIAFELGHRMGFPFTNHAIPVELILNGVYEGSYVLTEQVQVGKGRVDIDENEGFLVELDSYYDEEPKFTSTNYHLPVMIKSPEDLNDPAGYDFVKNAVNELDGLLASENFPNNGYRDLIDMDSFVKFLIINEVVGNSEVGIPKSAYMYRDKGKKIHMGPLWDFDSGFSYSGGGNNIYFDSSDYRIVLHPFFKRFFEDPDFKALYKTVWNQYYAGGTLAGMLSFIDAAAADLDKSQKANFTVWRWINKPVYADEIAKLKNWWAARVEYLNAEISKY
jgi:spore coat protein CotH